MTWQSLEEVREQALGCVKCGLSGGRTQVVWMDGNPSADLMFIGEAPGFHEDKQGIPFVGAAGKLLDAMLAGIGLDRTGCTICNVIKCRPPGNRDPLPSEIESCVPYLEAQIRFIDPRLIVTLGNFATRFVLNQQISISKVRGQRFEAYGAMVIPTFHPAAVLHGGGENSPAMAAIRSDFATIAAALQELSASSVAPTTEESRDAQQPSLF